MIQASKFLLRRHGDKCSACDSDQDTDQDTARDTEGAKLGRPSTPVRLFINGLQLNSFLCYFDKGISKIN